LDFAWGWSVDLPAGDRDFYLARRIHWLCHLLGIAATQATL